MLLAWRKVFEHLLHALVEILDVLVGLVRKGVAGRSPPDDCFGLRVEQIDNQSADLVGVNGCGRVSESTSAAPAPAAAESVVESVEGTLILSRLDRHDSDITPRSHSCHAL